MQETNETFLIFFFNVLLIIISFKIINVKNLISGILLLILLLIIISFISFFYNALFLSLLFIIIYVGAVLVLFLFTIMLLGYKKDQNFEKRNSIFFIIFYLIVIFVLLYLQKSQFFEYSFDKNLLYNFNLKIKQNFFNQTFLHINSLNFFEKIEKIGFVIFIEIPQIILYSTIILLMGMIASINISKLNNKFLKIQQKEIQIKRKIKETIKITNL